MDKTSTVSFNILIFSLSFTPNLCSSSIIKRPRSLKNTSLDNILCVPIIISIFPSTKSFKISVCSFLLLNLLKNSTLTPKDFILDSNVLYCWSASTVVGTKYATCFESITALNAALNASSVLPYPTSPQSNLSIGLSDSISSFISSKYVFWSGVSSYSNESSNSLCQGVSSLKAYPFIFSLLA